MMLFGLRLFAQEFNCMGQDRHNHLQIFHCGFGAARQVDDEHFATNSRHCPGEHGMRRDFQAFRAHDLGQTRELRAQSRRVSLRG